MKAQQKKHSERINVTLSPDTLRRLDQMAGARGRSRLIDEAVNYYLAEMDRKQLRERLKEGAIRRADRDRQLAAEWLPLENESWQENVQ